MTGFERLLRSVKTFLLNSGTLVCSATEALHHHLYQVHIQSISEVCLIDLGIGLIVHWKKQMVRREKGMIYIFYHNDYPKKT